MSTIQDFTKHIGQFGVAKTNRFNFMMGVPAGLRQYLRSAPVGSFGDGLNRDLIDTPQKPAVRTEDTLGLMAQSVTLPGQNVTTSEIRTGAQLRRAPQSRSFGDFDVVFMCSGDMREKKLFDAWNSLMFSDNHTTNFYDDVIADIRVQHTDEQGRVIYDTTLLEAYPLVVNPVMLDRSAQNQILTFQVAFAFWKTRENDNPILVTNPDLTTNPIGGITSPYDLIDNPRGLPPYPNFPTNPGQGNIFDIIAVTQQVDAIRRQVEGGLSPREAVSLLRTISGNLRGLENTTQTTQFLNYINSVIWAFER